MSGSPSHTSPGRLVTRPVDRLLAEYGASHRNPTNKLIHWIAVPAIFWCALALLSELPFPAPFGVVPWLDWAVVAAVLATLYYMALSVPLALGMAAFSALCLVLIHILRGGPYPVWQAALVIFAVAWVFQFIGHAIEGRRPSFFKDVQFLLIGPAWLMSFLFRAAGLRY